MIIAHLSDMHVGSQFQPDVFDILLEEINSIKPDAVVITGDLTNQGLVKEFEECKRLISRFKTEKLITMSGNHDYRNTGYLLFKKYFPFDHVNEIVVIVTVGIKTGQKRWGDRIQTDVFDILLEGRWNRPRICGFYAWNTLRMRFLL